MKKAQMLHDQLTESLSKADVMMDQIIQDYSCADAVTGASIAQDYIKKSIKISCKMLKKLRKIGGSHSQRQS